jgi:2'-hydroxyisoflavone reductase
MTTRRSFLKTAGTAAGALLAGCSPAISRAAESAARSERRAPMKILILGGTGFIGPYQVRQAVARGHQVSIFTRGRRQAELPDGIEYLQGDRNGQLDALKGRQWDAVIDNSATNPDWVRQSATLLKDAAGQYVYVSSTGVFYPYLTVGVDERTPVKTVAEPPDDGSAKYGSAKAASEQVAQEVFGDRATIVRPTFIVGPGDTTDRFPYWPVRMAAGGEVLAPGRKSDPVQLIDVRDLTTWMIGAVENRHTGVYNLAGPAGGLTMERFLETTRQATNPSATLTWIEDYDFLEAEGLGGAVPWILLRGNHLGFTSVKFDRALATGLTFRPLAETVKDTLAWWQTVPEARRTAPKFVLTREKEAEILAKWKARQPA